jgi:hypothetical protein
MKHRTLREMGTLKEWLLDFLGMAVIALFFLLAYVVLVPPTP